MAEYKDTLLMPKTAFEMRAGLVTKEPTFLDYWASIDLYKARQAKNEGKKDYRFHDGPPYANNPIHIGHALNKVLKDIVVRYKGMSGYHCPYIPGWDTHGLPIEQVVQKKGVDRRKMSRAEYRKHCREYALSQVERQQSQMMRLGLMADFPHRYLTLNQEQVAKQIAIFGQLAVNGVIYKGLKPVHWSPVSESALAEAELEYQDIESHAIYVAFQVVDGKGKLGQDDRVVIWTTTPWTLPANLAVCLNPDYDYGLFKSQFGNLLLLKSLAPDLSKKFLGEVSLIKEFKGKDLEGILLAHPFLDRTSLMIVGDHVTGDSGTGCVHTAPGHGKEDYEVGRLYQLPILSPVDSLGRMTEEAGALVAGLKTKDADPVIIEHLEKSGHLLFKETITHSYPHDWRWHQPVIFRATDQWFISLKSYKDGLTNSVKDVHWVPAWGEKRMANMMSSRDEWCISRQRIWGVPIPIIYSDGQPIVKEEVFTHIAGLVAKLGPDCWYELSAKELLPSSYPDGNYTKEVDIMDVWFDSGCTHATVMGQQVDLYLEGTDQFRGWFNASLITSVLTTGQAPFKTVVAHGMVLDGQGNKMSKSLGNTIDPIDTINTYGADILRLWVAGVEFTSDVRISPEILKQTAEGYRKIRNTFRFLLGNLEGSGDVSYGLIDQMIINRLHNIINRYHQLMTNFQFAEALALLANFLSNDLSSFYLDLSKDLLYCGALTDPRRQARVKALNYILDALVRLIAPIIPFTAEEIYQHMPGNKEKSVHLLDLPQNVDFDQDLEDQYVALLTIREEILLALEGKRREQVIGSAQEAEVECVLPHDQCQLLAQFGPDLPSLFIVSVLQIKEGEKAITIHKSTGNKCPRCWNYHQAADLCPRCRQVLHEKD